MTTDDGGQKHGSARAGVPELLAGGELRLVPPGPGEPWGRMVQAGVDMPPEGEAESRARGCGDAE